MRAEPLGDSAFVLRDLPTTADNLARFLNSHPPAGLVEAVASYDTVGLYVDPATFQVESVLKGVPVNLKTQPGKEHRIPVCYGFGPDLVEAAMLLKLSPDELIAAHIAVEYRCFAIGFCPGFPYLGYLPDRISGVARLPQPRKRVEPGMVGITGRQTGIYPLIRPGGWRLIGQTPLQLVAVDEDYFPIEAGDTVRFERISPGVFDRLRGDRLL